MLLLFAKSVQLCGLVDYRPPGSSVLGILQGRTVEWLPCPSPEDLAHPRINPSYPAFADRFFTRES